MQTSEWDLDTPPGIKPVRRKPFWLWILLSVGLVLLIIAAFTVPLPMFYAYRPGPVRDIEALVNVEDVPTYSSEGKLYMTTVNLDPQVTFSEWIGASFSPEVAIVDKSSVLGDLSLDEQIEQQQAEMQSSKQHAREVVFAALGLGKPTGDGARVLATIDGLPADGVLREGDVILEVNGGPVETTCEVGRLIDQSDVGETISIKVRRGRETHTFELEAAANPDDPGSPFIGVSMEDVNYRFDPGASVRFETGKIAGPSAGLMMSLALYDKLTPDDLTGGRQIAGTGTIACDGGVGPIGGIQQKVAGAEERGAVVFLAPESNAADARAVADEIEVVAISTFDEALDYLEGFE